MASLVWDASRARRDTGTGTFVVHERIAAGGMAEVFLATRRGLEGFAKPVVLKRILPEYAEDEKFCEMFVREARLGAHLSHPNVVQVLDLGRDAGSLFIALEYVPGPDLSRWMRVRRNRGRPFDTRLACHVVHEIVAALEHAHGAVAVDGTPLDIVHRDVSPHNVLVSSEGAIKLGDFGIARATSLSDGGQTQTGTVKGKLSYMSPEQARGEPVDARTDLFSATVILYELLTLQRPYGMSVDANFILRLHAGEHTPITQHRADLPPRLVQLVTRGLSARPTDRFDHAAEMRWEIARYLSAGPPIGRTEVAQALAEDLPDDVGRVRSLMHRALGRAQTAEHTETVELAAEPAVADAPERTVLQTQIERAFTGGTLLGLASPPLLEPAVAPRVERSTTGEVHRLEALAVAAAGRMDPHEPPPPAARRGWAVAALGLIFVVAVGLGAGIGLGTQREADVEPPRPEPVSVPTAVAPAPPAQPAAAPLLPIALEPPTPEAATAEPAVERPRAAPRATTPRSRSGTERVETSASERVAGSARLTVRAPNGWARVFLNGAGPFMAPFRERTVGAGRVSVRFESPRGNLTVVRQLRAGDAVVLSAP